jgi:hypothetical protein
VALARRVNGTVPVPEVVAADADGGVAGEPVMLSRFAPGVPLRALARRAEPLATTQVGARQLVHSDFNPKNILVADGTVTAVLDWEFAFSGSPLFDVGNMLRFVGDYPPAFENGFVNGFAGNGGHLPPGWRRISAALDLFALADLLTRPPDRPIPAQVARLIRKRLTVMGSTVDDPL